MCRGHHITLFVILVCIAGSSPAGAQELGELALGEQKLLFDHITVEDGLSQNTVNGILQDTRGFVWFGTEDGLNRYDGYTFKIYKHLPNDSTSLSNNYIWALDQDSKGNIWIATDGGGVNRFDPVEETFRSWLRVPGDSAMPAFSIVQTVMSDSSDEVFIGSWGAGLIRYDIRNDRFEQFVGDKNDSSGLKNGKIWSVYKDAAERVWLGTDGGGLYRFDDASRTFESFIFDSLSSGPLGCNSIIAITDDDDGYLWLGTYGCGLYRFDPASGSRVVYRHADQDQDSIADNFIWKLFVDRNKRLWIGTMSNGLDWYDPVSDGFSHYSHDEAKPKSISTDDTRSLYEDRSGNLWVGTLVGGVDKADLKKPLFAHVRHRENDPGSIVTDFVFAILEDKNGELWVGTYGGGLTRFDPQTGQFRHFRSEEGNNTSLSSNQIRSLFEDRDGDIWIGTYFGGLNRYDRERNAFQQYRKVPDMDNGLRDENIRCIMQDKMGRLWIGTNGGGLHQFEKSGGHFKAFFHSQDEPGSINSDYVISIAEGLHDDLWVGTYGGGLNRLDIASETFETFRHNPRDPQSLASDIITELYVDRTGVMWIGTWGAGLCRVDLNSTSTVVFEQFSELDGLAGNIVCGIIEDENETLWVSTTNGISRLRLQREPGKAEIVSVRNYDQSNRVQRDLNPGAWEKTSTGWFYFGGANGITAFRPEDIQSSRFQPQLAITDFKVFNESIKGFRPPISLDYSDRFFSFEFSSFDYTNPAKNRHRYRLEGFDQDWVNPEKRRYVSYTNLDPGDYVFRFQGSNSDGIWSPKEVSIPLKIVPPFWATTGFRLLMAAMFLAVFGAIYTSRVAYLKRERRMQEQFTRMLIQTQEQERKRIAGELHDSLGQDLLIINAGLDQCLAGDIKLPEISGEIRKLKKIAGSSIKGVREISADLHPHQLDKLGLKKAIESMAKKVAASSQIKLNLKIGTPENLAKDAEINIYRIIQEAMNNIQKHSNASQATIHMQSGNGSLEFAIEDDGRGFEAAKTAQKPGFGLTSIAERVKLLKGKLEIKSVRNQGTRLHVSIPLTGGEG